MRRTRTAIIRSLFLAVTLSTLSPTLIAQSTIVVEPREPSSITPVTLIVTEVGSCPATPVLTRAGFSIVVRLGADICLSPPLRLTHHIALGTLPAGRYDVTVLDEGAPAATLTFDVEEASNARTKILVPTLYNGPGAFGSDWWSSLIVNNHSGRPFSSPGVGFMIQCAIPEGCFSQEVPPGEFGRVTSPLPAAGLLLHPSAEIARNLAFQARFGSGDMSVGTSSELPLVRESEFSIHPIRLPAVAIHDSRPPVRSTLRIYGPDAQPGASVRVEVRHWFDPSGPVIAARTLTLTIPPSPPGVDVPIYPAYADLALQQEFPIEIVGGITFNITVVPLPLPTGEVPRIWAFVSITENDTQRVAIQRPQ